MKIIICGAGQVGESIAAHLSEEENDVTIIDQNQERIRKVLDHCDVSGVEGLASYPEVLQKAGIEEADMIIAVTQSDEVNMIVCQIAHSMFSTPLKIARIRAQSYLDPRIEKIYNSENLPIDYKISPELEVSNAVSKRLQIPGAFDVGNFIDGKLQLIGVLCEEDCPLLNVSTRHLKDIFPDLKMNIVAIIRSGEIIVPRDGSHKMEPLDRVYFVCDANQISRCMVAFGHEEKTANSIIIAGGGQIGKNTVNLLNDKMKEINISIIENNRDHANILAEIFANISVINGDALDQDILTEAGISNAETFVSLTNNDEVNILSSLLAKRSGAIRAVTLINKPNYIPLVNTLGINSVISPAQITVSSILSKIRSGSIKSIHSIIEDKGEVLEARALESSKIVGKSLKELKLPKSICIGAIFRKEELIIPIGETIIEVDDTIIIFSDNNSVKKLESILSIRIDLI